MLYESDIDQRVFDSLFHSIALLWLLSDEEQERVALSLERVSSREDMVDGTVARLMAVAIRAHKK